MPVFSLSGYNFYFVGSTGSGWVQPATPNLWMIGSNSDGQLGINAQETWGRSSPVQVPGSWKTVSVGGNHTLGIKSDGTLWAWGYGGAGALGVIEYTRWKKVSIGSTHSLAIKNDDTLWAWGQNSQGQLGDGTTISRSSPVQIGTSAWLSVAAGNGYTLGVRTNGQLFTWGYEPNGATGIGTGISVARSSPVQVTSPVSSWTQVSAANASFAITTLGKLFAAGPAANGLLGDGTTVNKSLFTAIGTSSWSQVSTRLFTSAGILVDGKLFTWGYGGFGQLGSNTTTNRSSPALVSATGTGSWSQVRCGNSHMVGIQSDGTLWSWGYNLQYQLGTGDQINKSSPIQVGTAGYSYSAVAAGFSSSYAISTDNKLWAWGGNGSGQLAQGNTNSNFTPTIVASPYTQVYAASDSMIVGNIDSQLSGAGYNLYGQLGTNTAVATNSTLTSVVAKATSVSRSSPIQVGTDTNWSSVYAGDACSFAIKNEATTAGSLWAWGNNGWGKLGLGDTISRVTPVQVGTSYWKMISSGGYVTAAIDQNSKLFTWGYGFLGGLGSNSTADRSSPVQVGTSNMIQVDVPYYGQTTYAITEAGALWATGVGTYGQLGNNSTVNRSTFVIVSGGYSWAQVSGGGQYAVGVTTSNTMFAWGLAQNGVLGYNSTINRSTPVQIGIGKNWRDVAAGQVTVFAETTDGYVWGWGQNQLYKTLETGDTSDRSSPVQIGSATQGSQVFNYNTTTAYLKP